VKSGGRGGGETGAMNAVIITLIEGKKKKKEDANFSRLSQVGGGGERRGKVIHSEGERGKRNELHERKEKELTFHIQGERRGNADVMPAGRKEKKIKVLRKGGEGRKRWGGHRLLEKTKGENVLTHLYGKRKEGGHVICSMNARKNVFQWKKKKNRERRRQLSKKKNRNASKGKKKERSRQEKER